MHLKFICTVGKAKSYYKFCLFESTNWLFPLIGSSSASGDSYSPRSVAHVTELPSVGQVAARTRKTVGETDQTTSRLPSLVDY